MTAPVGKRRQVVVIFKEFFLSLWATVESSFSALQQAECRNECFCPPALPI